MGSAIVRQLSKQADIELVTRSRGELDLTSQSAVAEFFQSEQIDQVYLAAAKVGGIHANNTYPAEFIYENLMMECNIIHQAYAAGVKQLLFLGSSCIYPKLAQQPMVETELLNGHLEATNEPYAIAKIAGIKLCESYNRQYNVDYRSVMPTNLYGENDNFHPENSHVIPAMMRRFHEAKLRGDKEVVVWGTGTPMREFLHVDDMAAACLHVMNLDKAIYSEHTQPMMSHINVGTGVDRTIRELGCDAGFDQTRFLGPYQHFYPDNFSGNNFSTHYVVLGYELKLDINLNDLPVDQHQDYRWFTIDDLLASEQVHQHTKDYFL